MPWSLEPPTAQGSQLVQPDYKKQTSTLDPGKEARADVVRINLCSGWEFSAQDGAAGVLRAKMRLHRVLGWEGMDSLLDELPAES